MGRDIQDLASGSGTLFEFFLLKFKFKFKAALHKLLLSPPKEKQ